ncbi:hypothetical protein BHE74_00045387 [Ensete ventricosum]|nr:hypothetical protein GW17_00025378 [Ensete ventricosum]RWW48527.1 hypothetical protein BHE74_00045387 [Ensete ventricosum]RZS00029.1 hypothetical protein BHM03_00029665 [Ensete ventricosum]
MGLRLSSSSTFAMVRRERAGVRARERRWVGGRWGLFGGNFCVGKVKRHGKATCGPSRPPRPGLRGAKPSNYQTTLIIGGKCPTPSFSVGPETLPQ